jgi:hypothetical protein
LVLVDQSAQKIVSTDGARIGRLIGSDVAAAVWWGELESAVRPVFVVVLAVYA